MTIFDALEDLNGSPKVEQQPTISGKLIRKFNDIKKEYPDALLLFRCGDFYEAYENDAVEVSKVCGTTLTPKGDLNSEDDHTEMTGFKFYDLDRYLPKLVRAGHRVAICDEIK